MKLTEKQLEKAARKHCELIGVDPEESVMHGAEAGPDGFVPTICLYSPRWRLEVTHIESIHNANLAINSVLQDDDDEKS